MGSFLAQLFQTCGSVLETLVRTVSKKRLAASVKIRLDFPIFRTEEGS